MEHDKLTEQEKELLVAYRLLDLKRRQQLVKAAEALRVASKPSKYSF